MFPEQVQGDHKENGQRELRIATQIPEETLREDHGAKRNGLRLPLRLWPRNLNRGSSGLGL